MSDDGNNKQFNGACVTLDSNFASAVTVENFFKLFLQRLQSDDQTSHQFATENLSELDVTVIPIGLRDLGAIKSEHTKKRDNYASERAEYECGAYASLFAPKEDPKYSEFYRRGFYKTFSTMVADKFANVRNTSTIKILSDVSYARVGEAMVNILLGYNLKGELNLVRRRKINPETVVKDESGNIVSFEYYTEEEINNHRTLLYKELADEIDFHDLDIGYIPNKIANIVMNLSVISSCKRQNQQAIPADFDVRTIFDLNHPNPRIRMMYVFLLQNAITDLATLDRIETRTQGKYSINDIIHFDSVQKELRENNLVKESLSMKEIYVTYLIYMKYIVILAEPLIAICDTLEDESLSVNEKVGLVEHEDSYINKISSILVDLDAVQMICDESLIFFNLPDYVARYLTFFIARAFTSVSVTQEETGFKFDFTSLSTKQEAVFKVASSVLALKNYDTENLSVNPFFKMFFDKLDRDTFVNLIINSQDDDEDKMSTNEVLSFFNKVYSNKNNKSFCEIHNGNMLKILTDKIENLNCYIYRNTHKYMLEDGTFSYDIALIENVVSYFIAKSSHHRKNNITPFSISGKKIIFNIEIFLDTIRRITGISSIDINTDPISQYKKIIDVNMALIDSKSKNVSTQLDAMFGESFIRPIVALPEIPYDDEERRWAVQKCDDLEVEAESIISFSSAPEGFEWNTFREAYNVFRDASEEYAKSDVENPALIKQIQEAETLFNQFSESCGLDSSQLERLKNVYQGLYSYSRLDKMRFSFKPFEFKFNTEIGFDMEFVISDNVIALPNMNGELDESGLKKRFITKTVQVIAKLYNGKKILDDYFRPFFEPFAKTNKESFKVDVVIHDSNDSDGLKKNVTILKVKFGAVKDLHECLKFRTFFFSIRDKNILFEIVREIMNIDKNDTKKIAINNIPKQFIIRWNKTREQAAALSGTDKSKTFKFYDEAKGCVERYPFFDDAGPRIIRDAFNVEIAKFLRSKERRAPIQPRIQPQNRVQVQVDDNSQFPVLPGSYVPSSTAVNNFWNFRNDKGETQVPESIAVNSDSTPQDDNQIQKREHNYASRREKYQRRDAKEFNNPYSVLGEKESIEKENQPKAVRTLQERRNNARTRMNSQLASKNNNNDGWMTVTYKGKTMRGYKKNKDHHGTNSTSRSKTPAKFRDRRSGDKKERETSFRTGSGTRRASSGTHSNTSAFISPRNGTPNSNGKYEPYNVSSPGFADKRGGGETLGSPSYFHPEKDSVFITASPSITPGSQSFTNNIMPAVENKSPSLSISIPTFTEPVVIVDNTEFEDNDDDWN